MLVTQPIHTGALAKLAAAGHEVVDLARPSPLSADDVLRHLGQSDALICHLTDRVDEHVLSQHAPLTPQTRHLIDSAAPAAMQPHAYLISAARGALIDEEALARALDVFEDEPRVRPRLLAQDVAEVVSGYRGRRRDEADDDDDVELVRRAGKERRGNERRLPGQRDPDALQAHEKNHGQVAVGLQEMGQHRDGHNPDGRGDHLSVRFPSVPAGLRPRVQGPRAGAASPALLALTLDGEPLDAQGARLVAASDLGPGRLISPVTRIYVGDVNRMIWG